MTPDQIRSIWAKSEEKAAINLILSWLAENGYSSESRDPAEQWEGIDGLLHFFVSQIAETARPKRCRWEPSEDRFTEWETECGEQETRAGNPIKENGMKYCPYCGGELVTDEN